MLSTMVSHKQDSFSLRASFSLCVEGENLLMAQQTQVLASNALGL